MSSKTLTLSREQAWTVADAAELAVLGLAFVDGFYEHRERCVACAVGGPWCPSAREAFEAVENWRRRRLLLSRAQLLRQRQESAA
jgi:hypothetical protein